MCDQMITLETERNCQIILITGIYSFDEYTYVKEENNANTILNIEV